MHNKNQHLITATRAIAQKRNRNGSDEAITSRAETRFYQKHIFFCFPVSFIRISVQCFVGVCAVRGFARFRISYLVVARTNIPILKKTTTTTPFQRTTTTTTSPFRRTHVWCRLVGLCCVMFVNVSHLIKIQACLCVLPHTRPKRTDTPQEMRAHYRPRRLLRRVDFVRASWVHAKFGEHF